jgi:hypothetical protein
VPKGVYWFHCVGPEDAVFDQQGCQLPTLAQVKVQADRVAFAVMDHADADWTRWIVDVRDTNGRQVLTRAFTEARDTTERVA